MTQETKIDPFADLHDKRLSELNEEQQERASEMWMRNHIGWEDDRIQRIVKDIFKVIDRLRADFQAAEQARIAAEAENLRLSGEVANRNRRALDGDQATAAFDSLYGISEGHRIRADQATRRMAGLRQALRKYGQHHPDCNARHGNLDRCDCGLGRALTLPMGDAADGQDTCPACKGSGEGPSVYHGDREVGQRQCETCDGTGAVAAQQGESNGG